MSGVVLTDIDCGAFACGLLDVCGSYVSGLGTF